MDRCLAPWLGSAPPNSPHNKARTRRKEEPATLRKFRPRDGNSPTFPKNPSETGAPAGAGHSGSGRVPPARQRAPPDAMRAHCRRSGPASPPPIAKTRVNALMVKAWSPARRPDLPAHTQRAGSGIGRGVAGQFAVDLAQDRDAVGEAQLRSGRDEAGIGRRRRAVDDEARAGQRLECRCDRMIAHPVVRPGEPRSQGERCVRAHQRRVVETFADLAPQRGGVAGIIGEREAAAGLAVGRRPEGLRLHRAVGGEPHRRRSEAPALLQPCRRGSGR